VVLAPGDLTDAADVPESVGRAEQRQFGFTVAVVIGGDRNVPGLAELNR
jgi:hypothetical protein